MGSEASRVQSMTRSLSGSPLATPSANTSGGSDAVAGVAGATEVDVLLDARSSSSLPAHAVVTPATASTPKN